MKRSLTCDICRGVTAGLVLVVLCSLLAFAQTETGQITGTITDATSAVVKGAKITAVSVNSGLTRETTSNAAGVYTVPGLKADTYTVTVESSGFEKVTRQVQVAVGSNNEVSVKLAVGKESQVVEVTGLAEAAAVDTESQTLSQVVTAEQLDRLPTDPTRNPYALVRTAGNVAEDSSSVRGAGFAINGMRSASTNVLLDGAENMDLFKGDVGQPVPLDSVQELSVLTNNFTAEFGRASGGVVNVVTKSGGNAFHGSAYEYNRLSALSANTFQNDATDTAKGVFTRNNFGFSLGGPIIKNKLFFFDNTEWIRVRSSAALPYTIIDPASVGELAPASQAYFAAFGKLGPGVRTLATGPCSADLPNSPTCDAVVFNVPSDSGGGNPQNTTQEVARIDYNLSDRTTLFGRYASYKEFDFPGVTNFSPYVGYNTGANQYDQNFEVNLAHMFGPSLLNTSKLIYNRINGPNFPLGSAPVGPVLYTSVSIPSVTVGGNKSPLIFPGYNETTPGAAIPFGGPQNLYQFYDDVSWTHGKHQLKFGGQYIHVRDNRVYGAYETPTEYLGGTTLDSGLSNLVSGNIYQFQGAVYPQGKFPCIKDPNGNPIITPECTLTLPVGEPQFGRNYHFNDGAAYAQDSWKLVPRFTFNFGVRWEYYGPQHNANAALDSNFVMGSGATFFDQIRNGSVQLAKDGGVFWKPQYHNLGPRIGFAWDVFGDGSTALRGGYGIGYERNFGNVTFNAIQNPPNYAVVSLQSFIDVPGALPVYTDPAGPLAGTGTKPLPSVSQRAINQNIKTAYGQTWNLTLDRRLGKGVLSLSYAGSHGVHDYDIANINPAGGGATFLGDARAANRINYQYSNMNYRSDNGFSHYNALNVKYGVTNLFSKGLDITTNYTWSHAMDNLSSTFTDSNGAVQAAVYQLGYLDAFNPRLNFGNADFDVRHRINASLLWELPWMKNSSNPMARNLLGGWGIGSIVSARTGSPFSIYDCTNATATACPVWIPNVTVPTSGTSVAAGQNIFNYIALPNTAGVVDNLGVSLGLPTCTGLDHVGCSYSTNGQAYPERNQYFGPGYWNLDMHFYKNFKLTERFALQFRSEFYNIFNHHNQYVTTENLDVSSLSTPFIQTEKGGPCGLAGGCAGILGVGAGTLADERRNIQFGLKLIF